MKFVGSQLAFFLSEREIRRNLKAMLRYLAVLAGVVALYTVLFHVIMLTWENERHSWVTGLYWTLTTMSTLGFGDITFRTDIGRLFSSLVLVSGIVLLLIMLPFVFIRYVLAPWIEAQVRLRAPRRVPEETAGHVIICSHESISQLLVEKLRLRGVPYFVIEPDAETATRLMEDGVSVVTGDVESRATYADLRAEKARLIFANAEDTTNTNIALTAREVAPDTPIAAIASAEDSIDILELSGCDRVLPLRRQLGEHLANRVTAGHARSHVIGSFQDLLIAEFPVQQTPFAGRTVRETRMREATGANIIAVWDAGRLHPAMPDTVLSERSVPVVVGTRDDLRRLDELLVIYYTNFNPVVVIGGGKVGRAAARALRRMDVSVHMIERNPEMQRRIGDIPNRLLIGDAADRSVLLEAGLLEAPSVVLTTHDDGMNIYLTVYCRRLNPDLRIVSRVTHDRNVEAVLRAGADFILSYAALGTETVLSLLEQRELVVLGEGLDLHWIAVPRSLDGATLAESGIGARTGLNVIAMRRDGRPRIGIGPRTRLRDDAEILAIGTAEQLGAFQQIFGGGAPPGA